MTQPPAEEEKMEREELLRRFNAENPVGTLVRYWRWLKMGEHTGTGKTRSEAWMMGGHTPVVLIEGTTGAIALTHVEPAPPQTGNLSEQGGEGGEEALRSTEGNEVGK